VGRHEVSMELVYSAARAGPNKDLIEFLASWTCEPRLIEGEVVFSRACYLFRVLKAKSPDTATLPPASRESTR